MAATADRVKERIAEILDVSKDRVQDDTTLKDLVTESFVLVEMAIELQEDFDVRFSQEDLKDVLNVGDLIGLILERQRS